MHSVSFLFEIKRVLVYNLKIFTDLFILYFFVRNVYADKKVFLKRQKVMHNGSTCELKFKFSEILTEPLNPRAPLSLILPPTVYTH